jgi:hypothetical protein
MSDIFTEHLFQKVLLSKRKIRNLLGSWFTKAFCADQKLFADFHNCQNVCAGNLSPPKLP